MSPYGARNRNSPAGPVNRAAGSGSRGRVPAGAIPKLGAAGSNGGSQGRVNKYVNSNYTPPNRKPIHSPAGSIGSNNNNFGSKKGSSPVVTINN